jgi:hypothetical protein
LKRINFKNTADDIAKVKGYRGVAGLWRRLKAKNQPYYKRPTVLEQFFHFDPNILKVSGHVYLDGYWQSERYFKDTEEIIRREFAIKRESDNANKQMADIIINTNAVSVHVRRSDYVNDTKTNETHGTCSLEYYREGTEIIARENPNPHFFVFSDDPIWVKRNLLINHRTTYVKHNDADKNYEDLRLMSLCKHNIIANSSFSWWGAWLNKNPEKIVIAPKAWFQTNERSSEDLIPVTWQRI